MDINRRGHRAALMWLLPLASFIAVFDASVVSIVLPTVREELGLAPSATSWVVNSYLVVFGGLLLLGGRLADIVARRTLLALGFALYAAASVASALAPSGLILILTRAVQGGAAALFIPVALALITAEIPDGPQRSRAFGRWGVASGAGAAMGALTGGVLASTLGWRWAFPVAGACAAVGALGALRTVPPTKGRGGSVDVTGAVCATASLAILLYAMVFGAEQGFLRPGIAVAVVSALALIVVFAWRSRRAAQPFFPRHLVRNRAGATANTVMLTLGGASAATLFLLPQYLQNVPGWSAATAGAILLAPTGAIIVASLVAPRLADRFGGAAVLLAGLGLTAVGLLAIAPTPQQLTGVTGVVIMVMTVVVGFGVGLSFVVATALGMATAPTHDEGAASGVLSTSREVGAALGIAVVTAAAAAFTTAGLQGSTGGLGSGYGTAIMATAVLAGVAIAAILIDPCYRRLGSAGSRA